MTSLSDPEKSQATQQINSDEARRVVLASSIGTTVEFYDFTLYGLAAVLVFGDQFFPSSDPVVGQLLALATLAAGFLIRPIGGLFGGHFGDRIGRKRVLVWSFMIMGVATLMIAFLPTYSQIGILAPIILLVLRLLQGFAAGAEYTGAALLAVEHAPGGKRGRYGAIASIGTVGGTVLGYAVVLTVSAVAPDAFVNFGWRIAFGLSAILIVVGLIVRRRVAESPLFELATKVETPRIPLLQVITKHPRGLLRGIAFTLVGATFSYTVSPYSIGWATENTGLGRTTLLVCAMVGNAIMIPIMMGNTRLLERARRRVLLTSTFTLIPAAIVFFPLLSIGTVPTAVLAYCVALGAVAMLYGTLGSVLPDQFPVSVGYTGVALSYNLAYAMGGFAPLVAGSIVAATGSITWMVVLLAVVAFLAVPAALHRPVSDPLVSTTRPAANNA